MWAVRSGLKLRVRLRCDEPRMLRVFNHLNDTFVWRETAEHETIFGEDASKVVVDLVAVTMALMDLDAAVFLISLRVLIENTRIGAETERAADILDTVLVRQKCDNRIGGVRIDLDAVGIGKTADIAGKLDDRDLHSEAQTKIRDLVLARIFCSNDHALDAAASESTRNDDSLHLSEQAVRIFLGQILGFDPVDIHGHMLWDAAVL